MVSQKVPSHSKPDGEKRLNLLLSGLILANLCITIPLAFSLNIWADEAYSLITTSQDLGYAVHQSIYFEKNTPFYFLVLYVWRQINDSIFFARLFSVFCVSLTIYISALTSKRYLPNIYPAWISTLITFHPFMIWAAVEIRLYALSILFSTLLLLLFHDAYLVPSPRPYSKWLFILVAFLSSCTFIPLTFLLLTFGIVLLLIKRQTFRRYVLEMLLVLLLTAPLLVLLYGQIVAIDPGANCPVPVGNDGATWVAGLKTVGRALLFFFLPLQGTIYQALPGYLRVLIVFLTTIFLVVGIRNYRLANRQEVTLWLIFVVASLILSIGMVVAEIYLSRYASIVFVAFLLSTLAMLSLIVEKQRKLVLSYAAIASVTYCISLYRSYIPMAKPGDFNRALAYIAMREQPNQPIMVFTPGTATTVSFLYQGSNAIVALPEPERFDGSDNWCRYFLKSEQEISLALSRFTLDKNAFVWLITEPPGVDSFQEYKQSFRILDTYVYKYYKIESNKDFYGSNVKLLRRR